MQRTLGDLFPGGSIWLDRGTCGSLVQDNGKSVKALLIAVHYGDTQPTLKLLQCFSRMEGLSECAVLIVDNEAASCSRAELQEAMAALPNIELHQPMRNLGYFGASRAGLDSFLAQGRAMPEWVIVCNHDILIEDTNFLTKLFLQDSTTAGVIAPRIQVLPGRADQNPFMRRRPGWLRWASLRLGFSNYGSAAVWDWLSRKKKAARASWFARRAMTAANSHGEPQSIYAPHGSFLIFSRKYFEAGGYLDANLFLYGEEISVAEVCRSLGLPVIYEQSLCVLHDEHQSTGKRITRLAYQHQKKALQYVRSRYLLDSAKPVDPRAKP